MVALLQGLGSHGHGAPASRTYCVIQDTSLE